MRSSDRRLEATPFTTVAIINGFVLAVTILLWAMDVLPPTGMVAILAVLMLVEVVVIVMLQRRASRRQARAHELSARSDASTLDDDSPHARYGYDPTDGLEDGRR